MMKMVNSKQVIVKSKVAKKRGNTESSVREEKENPKKSFALGVR